MTRCSIGSFCPSLGDTKIVALTPSRMREWRSGFGTEQPTRNAHAYALLHAVCATAVQDEVLDANPCRIRAAMQTKRKREVDVLTPAKSIDSPPRCLPRLRAAS